jgi:hypothetical protein
MTMPGCPQETYRVTPDVYRFTVRLARVAVSKARGVTICGVRQRAREFQYT